jgi:hypothetical protein
MREHQKKHRGRSCYDLVEPTRSDQVGDDDKGAHSGRFSGGQQPYHQANQPAGEDSADRRDGET